MEEGRRELLRARESDPLDLQINTNLAWLFIQARQYDQAIEQCRRTLELDASYNSAYFALGRAFMYKRMYPEAIAANQKAITIRGESLSGQLGLAQAYAYAGKRREAEKILNGFDLNTRRKFPYLFAELYVALGENDRAFLYLERAYQVRAFQISSLKLEPLWDPLRSDPRFQELLRRIGFWN